MNAENRLKYLKAAEKFFRGGKTDLAIKEYQKILEIKPDDLEIRRVIGDLYLKLNQNKEALQQFEWIADYYLKEGFFTKAIAMYKRITRLDPQSEEIAYKLADLYSRQGLIIEAKQIYLELAEEYKRQNNQKKALGIYKKILEFDRGNVKMRLLLADNYLKEGMAEEAVGEYLVASDIHLKKKEYRAAEDILNETLAKINHPKVFDKLITCLIAQGDEQRAIKLMQGMGDALYSNINLLKTLAELYFKNNQIEEAERIYQKVTEIDPSETEVIVRLGKVYLQREEFDRAFNLFLPTIDAFSASGKFDEANSLLRLIITSNNTYLPALNKLASIFKSSGKTNSLIAMYESLIPIYEGKGMKDELIQILQELIAISDAPFAYQEQLARISGQGQQVEEDEKKQEREFIEFQVQNADLAIQSNDYNKAADLLITAKQAFPKNEELRLKLFDIYQLKNDVQNLLPEGMELLQLYQETGKDEEYKVLLDKLTRLKPHDERLLDLSGHENTNIDIDFDHEELAEQLHELKHGDLDEMDDIQVQPQAGQAEEGDVLLLTGEDSVAAAGSTQGSERESTKGLSSHLVELDFYINEGYFDDAEKVLEKLRKEYPDSKHILARLEKIRRARGGEQAPVAEEIAVSADEPTFLIEASISEESNAQQQLEDSRVGIEIDLPDAGQTVIPQLDPGEDAFQIEMEMPGTIDLNPIALETPPPAPRSTGGSDGARPSPEYLGSSADFLNLDQILSGNDEKATSGETPFGEIDSQEMLLESEEDFLKGEGLLVEEERFFELGRLAIEELAAMQTWVDELEKQRTSTIEKNMMEIFREFKKGVDEKIGREDYDTRYNLGIAYKEMGLVEEAIHEFLISAKHPLKVFDSAGLLGICFRDKGMLDEAINWFEKALESPDRKEEEYKAVKYELVLTARLKDDLPYAARLAAEILKQDPTYRNIRQIYDEINTR